MNGRSLFESNGQQCALWSVAGKSRCCLMPVDQTDALNVAGAKLEK